MENCNEKKQSKLSKIISIVVLSLLAICFVFLVVVTISISKNNLASFFNYSFHIIQSSSMEDTIMVGDLVIAKKIERKNISVNDIVIFICEDSSLPIYGQYVAHRVVEIDEYGQIWTQGDNNLTNPQKDNVPSNPFAKVISIRHSDSSILLFLSNNRSLILLLIVILSVISVCVEFYSLLINNKKYKEALYNEQKENEIQKLKEEVQKELMLEMQQKNSNKNSENKDEKME